MLLTATLDALTGVLAIIGTNDADQIRLTLSNANIEVFEGALQTNFRSASVRSILIQSLGGDDSARIATDLIRQPATIIGGEGNDTLRGGGGSDSLSAGDGDDVLDGGKRSDVLTGGDGRDTLDMRRRSDDQVIILDDLPNDGAAGEGDNVQGDIETIRGGSGNDRLVGNGRTNRFFGYAGNDTLEGAKGNDTLIGGDGDDSIIGNDGDDLMIGEAGSDVFSAEATNDGNDDVKGDMADGSRAIGDDTWSYSKRVHEIEVQSIGVFDPIHSLPDTDTATSGDEVDDASGIEIVVGGDGDDRIDSKQSDIIEFYGGGGNDHTFVMNEIDRPVIVHGGDGADELFAYNGRQTTSPPFSGAAQMFGDAGDDHMAVSFNLRYASAREWHGGDGNDVADMSALYLLDDPIRMTLNGLADDGNGPENIFGDVETLVTRQGYFEGNEFDNTFIGANSTMLGFGGSDTFFNAGCTVDGGDGIDSYQDDPQGNISPATEIKFARRSFGSGSAARTRGAPSPGTARLVGTELRVSGTTSDDIIQLWEDGKGIHVTITGPGVAEPYSISPVKSKYVKRIRIIADRGNDVVKLGLGSTAATGRVAHDAVIYGGDGNDTIYGGDARRLTSGDLAGGNWLIGGNGNDFLVGGNGADYLDGGDQQANLQSDGSDTLDGGAGSSDRVDYSGRKQDLTISLKASLTSPQGATDEQDHIVRCEGILSGLGNDVLTARATGGGLIAAGKGNDRSTGSIGADIITDTGGNDTIDIAGDPNIDLLKIRDGDIDTCTLGDEDKRFSEYDQIDVMIIV